MVLAIESFRAAQRYLANQDIEQAAEHVWKAVFYKDTWPAGLQKRADGLIPLFFREGPIRSTVKQLAPADRETLRRRLLEIIELAEQAHRASA